MSKSPKKIAASAEAYRSLKSQAAQGFPGEKLGNCTAFHEQSTQQMATLAAFGPLGLLALFGGAATFSPFSLTSSGERALPLFSLAFPSEAAARLFFFLHVIIW